MIQNMVTKCLKLFCVTAVFVAVYFPARHARHYDYISLDQAINEISLKRPLLAKSDVPPCNYKNIILNNEIISVSNITEKQDYERPLLGGEYVPSCCTPLIKTALIVPYRNRSEQLNLFVNYMHKFLQHQNIHYRIIIAEQNDSLPFNRAKMMNYGARLAIDLNYTCLILHDVDLIPLTTGNLYGCSSRPRHMSSSLDTFRYNLPYLTLFGGAIAILSNQYKLVNGMSNAFDGWGGEDDDFYTRLEAHNLLPYRFAPDVSKYTMLAHKKQLMNEKRFEKLQNSLDNMSEGLSSLPQKYSIKLEDLYTKVVS